MSALSAIIAALQAIPKIVDLVNMFVAGWLSFRKGQKEAYFEEKTKQRAKLIARLKEARDDEEISREFDRLIDFDLGE